MGAGIPGAAGYRGRYPGLMPGYRDPVPMNFFMRGVRMFNAEKLLGGLLKSGTRNKGNLGNPADLRGFLYGR